ncbi:MAG: histone deacetylase [Verrucomicrobiota bacterium]
MEKFPQSHALLLRGGVLSEKEVHPVPPACTESLLRVHEADYLEGVARGDLEERGRLRIGLPLGRELLQRSARETEATRLAAWAALEEGLACNLAGGTHHAFPHAGSGFCVLNDVAVAVRDLHRAHPALRILVLDTDAHQGDATHFILQSDPRVYTYSLHVGRNFPSAKVAGDLDVPTIRYIDGPRYLALLRASLDRAFREFPEPDLVLWNSGADNHRDDRFGQMRLTVREMMWRDAHVLHLVREIHRVPLAVLYGGGYQRTYGHTARLHRNTIAAAKKVALGQTALPRRLISSCRIGW